MTTSSARLPLPRIQTAFLSALPRIEAHGKVCFRNVRCVSTKDECLAEMTALAWQWFLRLSFDGRNPSDFISTLACYAARAVKAGRRLCGQEKARDVLSPRAQQRNGFSVGKLPDITTLAITPLTDALSDNTKTPPDEQVCFRLDFPAWLRSLDDRRRRIALDLMMGERPTHVAHRHGCSRVRISRLRRDFKADWDRFCS